jgi:Icc-related predicted phosphoesterase
MKLFCISDLHGNLNGLDPFGCDLVIIAGDFAKMTGWSKWHMYDMKKWIEKKFIPFTQQYKNIQFVITPGNHDLIFDSRRTLNISDISYSINWPENVYILIDRQIEVNGLKIYGTPWVPIISYSWAFEAEHDKLIEKFSKIPENLDILITHSPPRISSCDVDYSLQTNNGPFGSSELTQAIFEKNPKYVFCGHIHSGAHNCIDFGNTKIFNVSRLNEDYNIAYEPLILNV